MDINATLFGQMITFGIFVWVTMKFVWPPLVRVMDERAASIAQGLKDARASQDKLEAAHTEAAKILDAARVEASGMVDQAQHRSASLLESARVDATTEKTRIVASAQEEIDQKVQTAREAVLAEMVELVISGAGKVLDREASPQDHKAFLNDLIQQGDK